MNKYRTVIKINSEVTGGTQRGTYTILKVLLYALFNFIGLI